MKKQFVCALGAALVAALAGSAHAAPMDLVDPALGGNTAFDQWTNAGLTSAANPGYGAFPGSAPWPGPIGSSDGGDAVLERLAGGSSGGGPFPSGGSLYFGSFVQVPNTDGGRVAIHDATPLADLENLVLQIQIGEASGWDFFEDVLPALRIDGGSAIAPTLALLLEQFDSGTFEGPNGPEPVYINTYLLQWDLTGVAGSIGDISIAFNAVQHAQVYQLRLDQSDVYAPVPEPGTLLLTVVGLSVLAGVRRGTRPAA